MTILYLGLTKSYQLETFTNSSSRLMNLADDVIFQFMLTSTKMYSGQKNTYRPREKSHNVIIQLLLSRGLPVVSLNFIPCVLKLSPLCLLYSTPSSTIEVVSDTISFFFFQHFFKTRRVEQKDCGCQLNSQCNMGGFLK